MSVVTTYGLTKSFGRKKAVNDLNFVVNSGDFFGLVGPDKSGKSTLLNLLMDFIPPTRGYAEIFRQNCRDESEEIKKVVGYIPHHPTFYDDVKVKSILRMIKQFYPATYDETYIEFLCERFNINLGKKAGRLSDGAQKRLAIVCALARRPKLLLMDEPTQGLDPIMYNRFFETMLELKEDGITTIIADKHLSGVEDLCNVVTIIREGEIVESKSISQIKKKRGKLVHVSVEGDISDMMLSLGAKKFTKKDGIVSFVYNSDVNRLIKSLAKFKVDDVTMEDIPLESEFISYNDTVFVRGASGEKQKEEELLTL